MVGSPRVRVRGHSDPIERRAEDVGKRGPYTPVNHFSLLKSVEDIFDTREHLGYAAQPGLLGFLGAVRSDISIQDF